MGTFHAVTRSEIDSLLRGKGFSPVNVPGTREVVYSKRVDRDGVALSLRVLTGIVGEDSRAIGTDAIRVVLVHRKPSGEVVGIRSVGRVNRTNGWARNLSARILAAIPNRAEIGRNGWVYVS